MASRELSPSQSAISFVGQLHWVMFLFNNPVLNFFSDICKDSNQEHMFATDNCRGTMWFPSTAGDMAPCCESHPRTCRSKLLWFVNMKIPVLAESKVARVCSQHKTLRFWPPSACLLLPPCRKRVKVRVASSAVHGVGAKNCCVKECGASTSKVAG